MVSRLPSCITRIKAAKLAALIRVMDHVVGLPLLDGHVERREHQAAGHALADRPAHDATAPDVEHDGQVDEAGPRRHVGHVGDPGFVGRGRREATLHEVRCWTLSLIAARRDDVALRRLTPWMRAQRISRATRFLLIVVLGGSARPAPVACRRSRATVHEPFECAPS